MSSFTLIDTHLHLIYRDVLSYPWLASFAPLNADFPLPRYLAEARRCGVTDALHMEVDVAESDIEAETRHVEALADPVVRAFAARRQGGSGAAVDCEPLQTVNDRDPEACAHPLEAKAERAARLRDADATSPALRRARNLSAARCRRGRRARA